ncbi:MAG: hypothetical protein K0Q67_1644 [Cellvibrio sp.]|jgi:hypothetical protein|nr:hypothetical protein [Cellvibrio sp.]
MDSKIIVSNRSALVDKYGTKGLAKITRALALLKAADSKRGIKSQVIYLDNKTAMKKVGGVAVFDVGSPKENKTAIDAICKKLRPEYLLILGAADVIPHQDLDNLVFQVGVDDDRFAWSDLPYACNAAYSRDPRRFIGPSRVVGRLPDLAGATEPTYLIDLLTISAAHQSRAPEDYEAYFSLSTLTWKKSTQLSLNNIFGNNSKLRVSPTMGPSHPASRLGTLMHFINCHGGQASPEFQGQKGNAYPIALTTSKIAGKIKEGTVAAVECCYGAELYEALTLGVDLPICQSYLEQGAYGYLGSTTIAYGPADFNGSADLICQNFLLNVLGGASLGRAVLMARQQYVADVGQMDPIDLKTLAQFYLLGDPSIHPVLKPGGIVPKGIIAQESEQFSRAERRIKLQATADFLEKTKPTVTKASANTKLSPATKISLEKLARLAGLAAKQSFQSFVVKVPAAAKNQKTKVVGTPTKYHLAMGVPVKQTNNKVNCGVAVVAKESDGRIVGYRIYEQR